MSYINFYYKINCLYKTTGDDMASVKVPVFHNGTKRLIINLKTNVNV